MKKLFLATILFLSAWNYISSQNLKLNHLGYFEAQGINVLVFSNEYTGMFFDEKTAGIELIQHGVRTSTGGAVRLTNTPEQWDLIPSVTSRKVDSLKNTIETTLRYKDYDFDSRIVVTAKGKGVEISVYLDKPLPKALEGNAGFNIEFLPSAYFEKIYIMDGRPNTFPRYPAGNTLIKPKSEKVKQFNTYSTFDDRARNEFIKPLPLETGRTIVLAPETPERMVKSRRRMPT